MGAMTLQPVPQGIAESGRDAARGRGVASRIRAVATALALAAAAASFVPSVAHAAPDAAKVRTAAEEFDEAVRLYKQKEFAEAASHFEAADSAVASPKALRLAIKSRLEAGQSARAATLAAYAIDNYPSDQETVQTAKETIEKLKPSLQEVKVSCASLCILSVGASGATGPRSVHGKPNTRWSVYVEPGKTTLSASFIGDLPGGEKAVEAVGGKSVEVRFEPSSAAAPPVAAPPGQEPAEPKSAPPATEPPPAETDSGGISPFFFLGGAILTAAAGGVTIWSGIDATNNPGKDAVTAGCVGQGTECSLYQDGLAAEMRTNVLIGVTAGLGATTLVLAILTDWDGDPEPSASTGLLQLGGVGVAAPVVAASPTEGAVSLHGRF